MTRIFRESLIDPTVGERRRNRYGIASQRPDPECLEAMSDFEQRLKLEQWLLNWASDSDVYSQGEIQVEKLATWWRGRFRDARTGKWRTVPVPLRGTPPPPGWKEGK